VPLLKDIEAVARSIKMEIVRLGVHSPDDIGPAFETAKQDRVQGLVVLRDAVLITHRAKVVELAARYRLPAMYGMREFVDAGGAHVLRAEPARSLPARRPARRQDPQGGQ